MDNGHKFVRRIPTFARCRRGRSPRTSRGSRPARRPDGCSCRPSSGRGNRSRTTERMLWNREYAGRLRSAGDIARTARLLYVPSLEGPHWHVRRCRAPATSSRRSSTNSGAHNTIYGADGRRVYLAGLKTPMLTVADAQTPQGRQAGRPVRQRDPPVHRSTARRRCVSSTSTICSGSKSAT